jgi:hypothetical protein
MTLGSIAAPQMSPVYAFTSFVANLQVIPYSNSMAQLSQRYTVGFYPRRNQVSEVDFSLILQVHCHATISRVSTSGLIFARIMQAEADFGLSIPDGCTLSHW